MVDMSVYYIRNGDERRFKLIAREESGVELESPTGNIIKVGYSDFARGFREVSISKPQTLPPIEINYHVTPFKCITYCLVTNKEQLRQVCKDKGVPKRDIPVKKSGAVVNFVYFDSGVLAIIQMPDIDHALCEKIGLLAHECVHIKQQFMDEIGEKSPSDEFEAYFVQEIMTNVVEDYLEMVAVR